MPPVAAQEMQRMSNFVPQPSFHTSCAKLYVAASVSSLRRQAKHTWRTPGKSQQRGASDRHLTAVCGCGECRSGDGGWQGAAGRWNQVPAREWGGLRTQRLLAPLDQPQGRLCGRQGAVLIENLTKLLQPDSWAVPDYFSRLSVRSTLCVHG